MNDNCNLRDLSKKNYSIHEGVSVKISEFICYLKKCVAVINSAPMIFVVKYYDAIRNTSSLSFLSNKEFKELMKSIYVGEYLKDGKKKPVDEIMICNEG